MQAVGQQSHGTEDDARGYFHHHRNTGKDDDNDRSPLAYSFVFLTECVRVLPELKVIKMHRASTPASSVTESPKLTGAWLFREFGCVLFYACRFMRKFD
jgi:hypothetical protein